MSIIQPEDNSNVKDNKEQKKRGLGDELLPGLAGTEQKYASDYEKGLIYEYKNTPTPKDFQYHINEKDGYAEIVKYTGNTEKLNVPAVIEGYLVRKLCREAFKDNRAIVSVRIPGTVTSLGEGLFENCILLKDLYWPGVMSTGNSVYDTEFEDLREFVGIAAENETVDFGQMIVDVAYGIDNQYVFKYGVSGKITFSNNAFGRDPYRYTKKKGRFRISGNKNVHIPRAMLKRCAAINRILFSESVTDIGMGALESCNRLEEAVLPHKLKSIADSAFQHCVNLRSVQGMENIEEIGCMAFAQCENLRCDRLPATVRKIGKSAFQECFKIYSLEIRSPSIEIEEYAFIWCRNLKFLKIFSEGITIKMGAFWECSVLSVVQVPKNCMGINNKAFSRSWKLRKIVLPPDTKKVGEQQLLYLKGLESLVITGSTLPELDSEAGKSLERADILVDGKLLEKAKAKYKDIIPEPALRAGIPYYVHADTTIRDMIGETRGVEILGYYGEDTCVRVPEIINALPVIKIGENAFRDQDKIEEIVLHQSIRVIGEKAFSGCKSLSYLVCPPKVKMLGNAAIDGCSSLRALSFLARDAKYSRTESQDCGQLQYIVIDGKTEGANPEWEDRSKFEIEIEDGHAIITDYRGYDDDRVIDETDCHTLVIPEIIDGFPVFQVGRESADFNMKGAFAGCEELSGVSFPPSVRKIGTKAFYYCTHLESLTIPKSVKTLSDSCFQECTALVSVNLQAEQLEMGEKVFCGCTRLEAAAIWAKEIRVGADCFADCEQLKTIYFHSRDGVDFLGESKERLSVSGKLEILSQEKAVESAPFQFRINEKEQTVTIQHHEGSDAKAVIPAYLKGLPVREIGDGAFMQNKTLMRVEIGSNVQRIGRQAFKECKSLEEIVIPEGIKKLEQEVFAGCRELRQATLPSSLEVIGEKAFSDCGKLHEVKLADGMRAIDRGAFCACTGLERIFLGRNLSAIAEEAFAGCSMLRHIMLPENIAAVRRGTFRNCVGLKSVIFRNPACIKEKEAFAGCRLELEKICKEIPRETVGPDQISYQIDAESGEAVLCDGQAWGSGRFEVPPYVDGFPVTAIADIAFLCNKQITSVCIGENIRRINSMAFYGCENLDEIVFLHEGNGPHICKEAFYALDKCVVCLRSEQSRHVLNEGNCTCPVFCIQGDCSEIGVHYEYDREKAELVITAAKECTEELKQMNREDYPWHSVRDKIRTVVMKGEITCVHNGCFEDCVHLKKAIFAGKVEKIGSRAFKNCKALSEIVLPGKLRYIGEEAFWGCESLSGTKERLFQFPQSLEKIDKRAFLGCQGFQYLVFPQSVQEIAARAFQRCEKLKEIYMEHEEKPDKIGGKVFYEAAEGCELSVKFTDSSMLEEKFDRKVILHVPIVGECGSGKENIVWKLYYDGLLEISGSGKMADYDGSTPPWNEYMVQIRRIVIEGEITHIGAMAFHSCNVETLELPAGLESIGQEAFAYCINLSDVKLPSNKVKVGSRCFRGCNFS